MKIDLGKILIRAWQIIWNYKILWVFGIFASFASGNGNGGGSNGNSSSSNRDVSGFPGDAGRIGEKASEFFQQYMLIIIGVCVALILISFAFYALGMMGRIGLLKGVYSVENGASSLMFGELWSESMPYFWRFFGLNFLVGLAFLIVFLPFIMIGILTKGIGLACLLPLVCLLIPVAWVVNVILEQAQAAIVAEDLSILEGFKRGWEIARSDIGGMIVLSLVFWIGGGIIGFVISLPIIAAVIPGAIGMMGYQSGETIPATVWVTVACCSLYMPVLIFLKGVLTAYIKTSWALSYLQLTKPAAPPENLPIPAQADA